jgi:hypothetical protein
LVYNFHNIVYQTLILLKTEINYFIRLLINDTHKKESINNDILLQIYNKYYLYFYKIGFKDNDFPSPQEDNYDINYDIQKLPEFDLTQYKLFDNDDQQYIKICIHYILKYLQNFKLLLTKEDNLANIKIYFEGIPTISKIREQINKRLNDRIINTIDTYNKDTTISLSIIFDEEFIKTKIIKTLPKISYGSPLNMSLNDALQKLSYNVLHKKDYNTFKDEG